MKVGILAQGINSIWRYKDASEIMWETLAVIFWLALCAWQDLRRRRVDNLLTLGACGIALAWLPLTGHSLLGHGLGAALVAGLLGLALTLPGYLLGKLGAADAKLAPALGLASEPFTLLYSLALACLVTVVLMLAARPLAATPGLPPGLARQLSALAPQRGKSFPFLFALFVGFLLQLLFISNPTG